LCPIKADIGLSAMFLLLAWLVTHFGAAMIIGITSAAVIAPTTFYLTTLPAVTYCCAVVGTNSNGSYVIVANYETIFTSVNSGANWVKTFTPYGPFSDVAVDATGQFVALVSDQNPAVLISTDYGSSWTLQTPGADTSIYWSAISCSASSQYVVAGQQGSGGVYYSVNYGEDWTVAAAPAPQSANWIDVGISSTGQHMVAVGSSAVLSSDYGATWTVLPAITAGCLQFVSMSASGQEITVVNCYEVGDITLWQSTDYGVTWRSFQPAGLPLDGGVLAFAIAPGAPSIQLISTQVNGLFVSNSSGTTWVSTMTVPAVGDDLNGEWPAVAVDYSGSTMFALAEAYQLYSTDPVAMTGSPSAPPTSKPSAVTTPTQAPTSSFPDDTVFSKMDAAPTGLTQATVASDSTGQFVIVGDATGLYASMDSGQTWSQCRDPSYQRITSMAVSANGSFIAMTVISFAPIYVSTDFCKTWSYVYTADFFSAVACSSTCQYMAASQYYLGGVYYTASRGVSWDVAAPPVTQSGKWKSVAVSDSGKMMAAVSDGDYVVLSSDYGQSWTALSEFTGCFDFVRMSASGAYIIIVSCNTESPSSYQSFDSGTTWTLVELVGVDSNNKSISSFAIAAVSPQYQVLGATSGGIFVSSNYGASWTRATVDPSAVDDATANEDYSWSSVTIDSTGNLVFGYWEYDNALYSANRSVTAGGVGGTTTDVPTASPTVAGTRPTRAPTTSPTWFGGVAAGPSPLSRVVGLAVAVIGGMVYLSFQ
jgi:photosystem II stability/assembly factor-like uncharacterized protein